jgi:hypothetical protein
VNTSALRKVIELLEEAEERDNPLQVETCNQLFFEIASAGGAMDPTFETCPDGSIAVIGECG